MCRHDAKAWIQGLPWSHLRNAASLYGAFSAAWIAAEGKSSNSAGIKSPAKSEKTKSNPGRAGIEPEDRKPSHEIPS
jgi:hypothetical protein